MCAKGPHIFRRQTHPSQVSYNGNKGCGSILWILRLSICIQISNRSKWNILTERVYRKNHISPPRSRAGWSVKAFSKGIKAHYTLQKGIQPQPKGSTPKFVKNVPQKRILGHNFVQGWVICVWPDIAIVCVEINNITFNFSRVKNIKCITQCIR